MTDDSTIDRDPLHPERTAESRASWLDSGARGGEELREQRFEFNSRGDRVAGRLLLPPGEQAKRLPLALVAHGAGGDKDAANMEAVVRPWVRAGASVALIDLPLHGGRFNPKLTPRLLSTLSVERGLSALEESLWCDLARQARADLSGALDVLVGWGWTDPERIVFAGYSLGALLGMPFCVLDARVRAAALSLCGAGVGPAELDPAAWVPRFAPRPLLFVNGTEDELVPKHRAEALHAAAREPKRALFYPCGHDDLPGAALKETWAFLSREL